MDMSKPMKKTFESLAKEANPFLSADGFPLHFHGYKETMRDYFSIHDHDILDIHNNLVNCNLWAMHFSEIESLLSLYQEKYALSSDWYKAIEDLNNPSAELEALYQEEFRKFTITKQLKRQCRAQKTFFNKAANHCLYLYKKATKNLSNYSN